MKISLILTILQAATCMLLAQGSLPATSTEKELIAVLNKADASQKDKADACRLLARIGTRDAVAPLAALLTDEKLSHMARYGLETIPDASVDAALRSALGKVKGRLLAGVIGSLGVRHDAQAVDALTGYLAEADVDVSCAAARALGSIATPAAVAALKNSKSTGPTKLAVYEGLFRAAESLSAQGRKEDAWTIYNSVRQEQAPMQVRAAALRGAIMNSGDKGDELVLATLRGEDYAMVEAAMRTAQELNKASINKALAAELAKLPADKQIIVLQTLGWNHDSQSLGAVTDLVNKGEKNVRVAALKTVAELGGPGALPVFMKWIANEDKEIAAAASEGLASLQGPAVDAAVLALLEDKSPEKRRAGAELIGRRRMLAAVPQLLKAGSDSDPKVSNEAMKRLGELGTVQHLPGLLDQLGRARENRELDALEQALSGICSKADDKAACVKQLADIMGKSSSAQKIVLVKVLGSIGNAEALASIKATLQDAAVRPVAIRTMGDWHNNDVANDLLDLAKSATNPTEKLLCLRSYLRLAGNQEVAAPQRLAMCKSASSLAATADEKKLLLAALGGVGNLNAVKMIEPFLADNAVKAEASLAILSIADKMLRGKNIDKNGEALKEPLNKVVQAAASPELVQRAQAALKLANAGK